MQNESSQLYAALPERLYVVQEGRIRYKGKAGPWNYNPEEVRAVLEKLCTNYQGGNAAHSTDCDSQK